MQNGKGIERLGALHAFKEDMEVKGTSGGTDEPVSKSSLNTQPALPHGTPRLYWYERKFGRNLQADTHLQRA